MAEEITISLQDMETFLESEEYQAFVRVKEEVDAYIKRNLDHEIKKLSAGWVRDECQKRRDEAKSDVERSLWDSERFKFMMEALMPAPYKPIYYLVEHDRYIELVRKRKLEQLEEQERRKAEEEAERRREEERKQREQQMMLATIRRKKLADSEWQEYQKTLKGAIKDLKGQLSNPKPPKFPPKCAPEVLNYHPELWCDLESPSDDEVGAWAKPQILEKIPKVLQPFVTWDLTPQMVVVPKAEYELIGVPCLVWDFDIYIVAKVDLWLKESTISREFHGCKYVALLKAEKLGSFFLKAQFWRSQEGFTTPIALLALLAEGKLEAPGIKVERTYPGASIYTVAGFEERRLEHYYITVQEEFRRFIRDAAKDQSLAQALLAKGLIDEVTAQLVEEKAKLPLPQLVGAQASAEESTLDNSDVEAALEVFGYKKKEIKQAMEAAHLSPGMSTEEKVKAVLKILDGNFP